MSPSFDTVLARTDPVRDDVLFEDPIVLDAALAELRDAIVADEVATRRRRKSVVVALVAAAALGIAATGAAATGALARTGLFGSGGEDGTGEFIELGAPDAPSVINDIGSDIPWAPGASPDETLRKMTQEPGLITESGVRSMLAWNAACSWATAWLNANAAG